MLTLLSVFLLITIRHAYILASYCGEDAIPFSLQALSSGQPVLGCARPSCFGWGDKNDKGSSARFYRIHKKNDGFVRKNDLKKYDKVKIASNGSQLAVCEKNYASLACDENSQWVGGISPSSNITAQPLFLQCCKFGSLKDSWDRGVADVAPGQIVVGGEVMHGDRQYAFDYIANIKKYTKDDGSLAYSVAIRRFSCVPYPTTSDIHVEENARSFIINRMAINQNDNAANTEHSPAQVNGDSIVPNGRTGEIPSQGAAAGTTNQNPQVMQPSIAALSTSPVVTFGTSSQKNANFTNSFQQESPSVLPAFPLLSGLSILPLKNSTPPVATLGVVTANQQQVLAPANLGTSLQPAVTGVLLGQPGTAGQQPGLQPLEYLIQPQLQQPQQLAQAPQHTAQPEGTQLVDQSAPPGAQQPPVHSLQPESSQYPIFPSLIGLPMLPVISPPSNPLG